MPQDKPARLASSHFAVVKATGRNGGHEGAEKPSPLHVPWIRLVRRVRALRSLLQARLNKGQAGLGTCSPSKVRVPRFFQIHADGRAPGLRARSWADNNSGTGVIMPQDKPACLASFHLAGVKATGRNGVIGGHVALLRYVSPVSFLPLDGNKGNSRQTRWFVGF